jgi:hypothetical protein
MLKLLFAIQLLNGRPEEFVENHSVWATLSMIPVQPIWNNLDQQTVVGVKVKLHFFKIPLVNMVSNKSPMDDAK